MRLKLLFVLFFLHCVLIDLQGARQLDVNFPPIEDVVLRSAGQETKLCGINCMYFVLKMAGDENIIYEEVLGNFPNAVKNGVSLNEIKKFIEKRGYSCEIFYGTNAGFAKKFRHKMAIALEEGENLHFLVKYAMSSEQIACINPPFASATLSKEAMHSDAKQIMLIINSSEIKINFYLVFLICFLFLTMANMKWVKKMLLSAKIGVSIFLFSISNLLAIGDENKVIKNPINCDIPFFDGGAVFLDSGQTAASHVFKICNISSEKVKIKRLLLSCSCASANISKNELLPGEVADLEVTINLSKEHFNGLSATTLVETYNAPGNPLKLKFSAKSAPSAYIIPAKLNFGIIKKGMPSNERMFFYIFMPTTSFHDEFITSIESTSYEYIETEVLYQKRRKFAAKSIEEGYFFVAQIAVRIKNANEFFLKDPRLIINLITGDRLSVEICYNLCKPTIFSPDGYDLTYFQNEKQEMTVTYDSNLGGKMKTAVFTGNELKIIEIEEKMGMCVLRIGYSGLQQNSAKNRELIITTMDGRVHTMEFILQNNN